MLPSVSPSKPPPPTVFGKRQERLAAYAYASLRGMEMSAAWIASTSKSSDKILLGTKLGIDGAHLLRLADRLSEMYFPAVSPAAPAAYEENFANAAKLTSVGERLGFLAASSRDVVASITRYLESESGCADEPSLLLIRAIQAELGSLVARLEAAGAQAPSWFIALESVLGTRAVTYSGQEPIPELVDFPAREDYLRFEEEKPPAKRKGNPFAREALAPFFHNMFVDVEIPATEVCARMIVEFREMPLAFKADMARQAWDECRHAVLVLEAVEWSGAKAGDFPYHAQVWRRYLLGDGLAERIAIQQLVQEGNSCDKAVNAARALRGVGHNDIADMMDQIIADEVLHVRFGNRWVMHLCNGEQAAYDRVIKAANAKINFPLGPVNELVRSMGGFPPVYVQELRKEFERILADPKPVAR